MKKVIMIMCLMILLIATGCAKNEKIEEKEEVVKSVYCDSCGEESKEVTKFCSSCGEEAKWVYEKPEVSKKLNEDEDINNDESKDNEVVSNKEQCTHCLKYFNSSELSKFSGEILCEECDSLPKTCENGFDRICDGCDKCKEYDFTYEQAISIAEDYYDIKDHPNDFVTADMEPRYDGKGKYYKLFLKSKEMLEQGTNGILFAILVYEDGTVVEDF